MKLASLDIIIVSYNTKDLTLSCIESVVPLLVQDNVIVHVIDNSSSDGSADAIAERFPQVKLHRLDQNIGFAAANNLAAGSASGDFILLLNPDTVVLDDAIVQLMAFAQTRPEARIWGGRTVYSDNSLNPASCWMKQSMWSLFCQAVGLSSLFRSSSLFNPEGLGGWDRSSVRDVDIVSGCFLLIDRQMWEQLRGFDIDFFMYGEEADLCLRAARLGAQPCVTPAATIVHYGGASETVQTDKICRLLNAKKLLIKRHFAPGTRRIGVALLYAWPLTRMVATGLFSAFSRKWLFQAKVWREIWKRRRDWAVGFPTSSDKSAG